jgi:hypothetical protein
MKTHKKIIAITMQFTLLLTFLHLPNFTYAQESSYENEINTFYGSLETSENLSGKIKGGKILRIRATDETEENIDEEIQDDSSEIGTPLTIEAEEYEEIKNIVSPIREYYYGNYWLELTDEDMAKIPEGVQYKVEEGAFQIGGVDPLLDELEIPVELQAVEGDGDEKGLYILQYVARNMTDWNQRIKDLGIDKIGYTGGTNYLVWASPNELEQAKQFDFVRAVVPYHGEFKIRPNLKDKFGQLVDIDVWYYFDGENYEKTRNRLIGLGGVSKDLHPRTPTANGEQSMRFGFQLDETTLYELARMPQVISLSWGAPIVPTTR